MRRNQALTKVKILVYIASIQTDLARISHEMKDLNKDSELFRVLNSAKLSAQYKYLDTLSRLIRQIDIKEVVSIQEPIEKP